MRSGNTPSDSLEASTISTVARFNDAVNRHDVDGVMALMTDDCVFENTYPSPDGERFEGQSAVRGFWEQLFAESPAAFFETEGMILSGDRCTVLWRYRWGEDQEGQPAHIRGVDVIQVRDGKIAEKLSYVKG